MPGEALWSPFDPAHIRDPYQMYERLRNEAPIYRSQTGEYIISRYQDVKTVLKSSDFRSGNRLEWLSRGVEYFKNHDEDLGNIYKAVNSFVLFLNPPDHLVIRNFIMRTWDDREVEQMITAVADEQLRKLGGSFDVVKDYTQPVPALVICRIMGIPLEEFEYLRALGVKMVRSLDLYHSMKQLVELNDACAEFVKHFEKLISAKRDKPDSGIISKLVAANEREKLLSEEQLISVSIFLFVAGEETTSYSIGTALHDFIEGGFYQQLRNDTPLLRTTGIEEFFRYDGPVHLLGRIAKADTVLNGVMIPADSSITVALGSANRDESNFKDANAMDLHRSPNQHLAFGYGSHFCLGEWLGKLQTRIAVERFMLKFSEASLPLQEIQWFRNIAVRGMTSLIVNTKE